jgi:ABC-type glycerol-3-phosphate transport system permease component
MAVQSNVKSKKKAPVFAIVLLVVLIVYMISLITPMVWLLYTSFKGVVDFQIDSVFPTFPLTFEPYIMAFENFVMKVNDGAGGTKEVAFEGMMFNSIVYSLGCTLIQTSVICVTAYTTSRFDFKFDKVIYNIVIITMILPIVGSLPSELRIAKMFGLYNKLYGMFVMKAHFLGMYYLVFHAMFRGIPKDYDEAAYIDGANNFVIFFKIILPLASGTFLTISLINFIGYWNDYTTPLVYMPDYPTIAFGLYDFVQSPVGDRVHKPVKLAACMLVFIPNFTVFLIFRNKLIGNISMGGLKG